MEPLGTPGEGDERSRACSRPLSEWPQIATQVYLSLLTLSLSLCSVIFLSLSIPVFNNIYHFSQKMHTIVFSPVFKMP